MTTFTSLELSLLLEAISAAEPGRVSAGIDRRVRELERASVGEPVSSGWATFKRLATSVEPTTASLRDLLEQQYQR
ncbi:MAG: hypothetical protein Q8S33_36420 [Myxococcales bacterium]|nr:hypothetical protein [Myxococcales bacterium]MDP3505886.1 hypothetical protein [Myxococcales bacterium]